MKKQIITLSIIILLAGIIFISQPVEAMTAQEYNELHCPKVTRIEDSLGNVSNGADIGSSPFVTGAVNTITITITAVDPQNLPLYYRFSPYGSLPRAPSTDWTTNNTLSIDVTNAADPYGRSQNAVIEIDNRDGYSCANGIDDTSVALSYTIYPPGTNCQSFTYSDWSTCQPDGTLTRTIISSSPIGCSIGSQSPILSARCAYAPPTPLCTSNNWSCGSWSSCSANGMQSRACNKTSTCTGGAISPATTQSCDCTSNSWSCTGWSVCSENGTIVRTCTKLFDCAGAPPATSLSCIYSPIKQKEQAPEKSKQPNNESAVIQPETGASTTSDLVIKSPATGAETQAPEQPTPPKQSWIQWLFNIFRSLFAKNDTK